MGLIESFAPLVLVETLSRSGVIGGYRLLWVTMWASVLGFIMQVFTVATFISLALTSVTPVMSTLTTMTPTEAVCAPCHGDGQAPGGAVLRELPPCS